MAALVAAIFVIATLMPAAAQPAKRSGAGPCRQGALSLISLLDSKEDNTPDYRNAYDGVVQTCGPATGAPSASAPSPREDCGKLALALLDIIEDGKINTQGFVAARTRFALSCAPR
jgi:hypothetical protein